MLTVRQARDRILSSVKPLPPTRTPLEHALGLVLAEDVVAGSSVPPFANSAMDGYAVRAADVRDASSERPVHLRVTGEIRAGSPPPRGVTEGTALRIMTGAGIPEGADAVVRVEDTSEQDGEVLVRAAVPAGMSLRAAGSDIRSGERVAEAGQVLTPGLIGVIASAGRGTVACVRRPRILLLTTGDELREPGEALGPGQIVNTNRYSLRAAVAEAGGEVLDAGVARDDRPDLEARLDRAKDCDLVLSTGGVSMGAYDLVRDVLEERGAIDFWQVALRPGKPLAFGSIHGVPLIGLPGNPVSALVGFELFVRPAIRKLLGHRYTEPELLRAIADDPLDSPPHLDQYFRGIARRGEDGLHVRLTGDQGSHVLQSMARANCLLLVPMGTGPLPAGSRVDIIPLGTIS